MLRARLGLTVVAISLVAWTAGTAVAATAVSEDTDEDPGAGHSLLPFGAGLAVGFATHEAGHLTLDVAFDAHPGLEGVDFHGIPFFAVSHDPVTARQEALISWAGFGVQHAATEWILTREPDLRSRHAPFRKGILGFHVLCSAVYGVGAFGKTGPAQRDTRGIARSVDVDERWIGALVVVPAALDTYRYFHPRSRWAPWTSRALKVGLAVLVLK